MAGSSPAMTATSLASASFGFGMPARERRSRAVRAYASPSVSNIAALIASAALLPAQTTNWNAG